MNVIDLLDQAIMKSNAILVFRTVIADFETGNKMADCYQGIRWYNADDRSPLRRTHEHQPQEFVPNTLARSHAKHITDKQTPYIILSTAAFRRRHINVQVVNAPL